MSDTPLQRNGTATAPMSCEEAQLHKERLQALAEKRKRQTEIEDKRGQLDDMVLQLQHLKSKAMRERWLLQGTGLEEEEVRRTQLEQDEEKGKRLEDLIHSLESDIGTLESEESQISAKEQVLRERLKETERSIEDLQKSLMNQDGDATCCMSTPCRTARTPIPTTSAWPRSPGPAHLPLESTPYQDLPTSTGHPPKGDPAGHDPPSTPVTTQPASSAHPGNELSCQPQATAEHPVTMVFLGYQDVEDTSESRRLLGFDGAVKAEVVLIDEDDEKSLREKTVTDLSIIDGTAADLVSGRPATSEAVSTELSSDGREPDSASSPPANDANTAPPPGLTPATGYIKTPEVALTTTNGYQAPMPTKHPHTAMKSWRAAEDVSDSTPRERALKSVSFQESVSVITDRPASMELESQQMQHGCLGSPNNRAHGEEETPDSEVAQEIRYLDQVLDAASETPTNGTSSPSDHHKPISVDRSSPSVCVSASPPVNHQHIIVEGHRQTTFLHQDDSLVRTNGHVQGEESGSGRAKFELRAFQEERRPAKLFTPGEEQHVRVTRTRPTEEVHELERERQELIKDQAVKKNPGIARRWWNPPQEVPLEEQLETDQLESLKKYQERKQQRQNYTYTYTQPQVSGPPSVVTFDPELTRKEDILEKQIDFSSARRQFLLGETTRKDVAPQIYSAKPFSKATTRSSQGSSDIVADTGESHVTWSDEGIAGEFTCARAVMKILHEEEEGKGHFLPPYHPEESDSGLDDLSVRSQDTTVFSLDNVSDSGASLPPTPLPLTPVSPPTPQPTTPVNGQTNGSPTEDELEFHAGMLVQNAIQNALAAQNDGEWQPLDLDSSQFSTPVSPSSASTSSPVPVSFSPVSSGGAPSLQSPVSSSPAPSNPSPLPERHPEVRVTFEEKPSEFLETQQPQLQTPSPPPSQTVSPPQRARDGGPRIKIQSSYARALASSSPAQAPASTAPVSRPTPVYRPPSPPSPEKPEYSYFSKYSEAAELRSTAVAARCPEPEAAASGPFRLRSKKQRTLSMIEEEIRAAQQREEELKKQRETGPVVKVRPSNVSSSGHGPVRTGMKKTTITPADKMKSNSLPTRLTLTAKTAPGKIEKVRPVPPVSPSPSEGALSDAGSEDSGGSRPKNYMQTLMEDFESHKVKRREKIEDNSVLEATRVTRRKRHGAEVGSRPLRQ